MNLDSAHLKAAIAEITLEPSLSASIKKKREGGGVGGAWVGVVCRVL